MRSLTIPCKNRTTLFTLEDVPARESLSDDAPELEREERYFPGLDPICGGDGVVQRHESKNAVKLQEMHDFHGQLSTN